MGGRGMKYRCNSCTRGPCHCTEQEAYGNWCTPGLIHGPKGAWSKNVCKLNYSIYAQWRPVCDDTKEQTK